MKKKRMLAGCMVAVLVISSMNISADAATDNEKEEVVYVVTDAGGEVDTVNVVNIFGSGKVTDYGKYSNVKMLNNTEAIKQDGDTVSFDTSLDKVYYQGTLEDAQLPWDIQFTYLLDGKEISPEQLAGKSGSLEIHIQITENKDGEESFYDNYALQANITLDTSRCKNIKAEDATLANVGSDKQISYTVLPGKGLDASITTDVTDFEMDAATINGVRMNLNLDLDEDELTKQVTEIMDATKKLNDGATELADNSDTLVNGADSLSQGTASMNGGLNSLNQGISSMQTALNQLNENPQTLTNGSAQVLQTLKQIQTALSDVSLSADELQALLTGSSQVRQGIQNSYDGAVNLQQNTSYEAYKAALAQNGLDIDQLQTMNAQTMSQIDTQIANLNDSIVQLQQKPDYATNADYQNMVSQMQSQITALSAAKTTVAVNNQSVNGTAQYFNGVSSGASDLVTGLSKLNGLYATFDDSVNAYANTLSDLSNNISSLKTAIDQLTASYEQLDGGVNAYTDGVSSLASAYNKIANGANTLTQNSTRLVSGSQSLAQGSAQLSDGIKTLNDGTNEFYEKTEGMDDKISDELNDNLGSLLDDDYDVVSFVSDKNTNVSSVQFVMKTTEIKQEETAETTEETTEDTGFFQKFLNLFHK